MSLMELSRCVLDKGFQGMKQLANSISSVKKTRAKTKYSFLKSAIVIAIRREENARKIYRL